MACYVVRLDTARHTVAITCKHVNSAHAGVVDTCMASAAGSEVSQADDGTQVGCRAHWHTLGRVGEGHGWSEHMRHVECIGMDRKGPDTWGLHVYGCRTYAGGLGGACGQHCDGGHAA